MFRIRNISYGTRIWISRSVTVFWIMETDLEGQSFTDPAGYGSYLPTFVATEKNSCQRGTYRPLTYIWHDFVIYNIFFRKSLLWPQISIKRQSVRARIFTNLVSCIGWLTCYWVTCLNSRHNCWQSILDLCQPLGSRFLRISRVTKLPYRSINFVTCWFFYAL